MDEKKEHASTIKCREKYLGTRWKTNEGCWATILEYISSREVIIKFDITENTTVCDIGQLKKGAVKNVMHISVFGVGYIGVGDAIASVNRKSTKEYQNWNNMLERSYCPKYHKRHPTYIDCTLHADFQCFQDFYKWFNENYKDYMQDWQLDKDMLTKGNKIYSPQTCCFLPPRINAFLINGKASRGLLPVGVSKNGNKYKAVINDGHGKLIYLGTFDTIIETFNAYKTAKEKQAKELAEEFKNLITNEAYKALCNFKVEITD